jgi:nicotinamidase-related amidase
VLDPATTILMLMDLQNGIVPGFDEDGAVMAAAQQALATAREHGAHVGYIRVGLTPEELEAMPVHAPMGAMIIATTGSSCSPTPSAIATRGPPRADRERVAAPGARDHRRRVRRPVRRLRRAAGAQASLDDDQTLTELSAA